VLWPRGRYTAQSLQLSSPSSAVSSTSPTAIAPGGPTTTDTAQHVTVLENSATDVTTKFVGSVAVEKNDETVSTFSSPSYVKAISTEFLMTLKKSLCRPVQIAQGSWSTSDTADTTLASMSLPEALLAFTIFTKKLDGFQGVRGSITLRLQATANPFQQGILKLQFYPMAYEDLTFAQRTLVPESYSYWPSVEINLGKETACELRVPFTLPVSFCDLVVASSILRPQMGQAFVRVYAPLKAGPGSASVGWNIYAHWNEDDLELFNPTPNQYQSGAHQVAHKQMPPSEKEKKSQSISSALDAGANLAAVASAVPVLADIAGPTQWALRVGARVASALGFARPGPDAVPTINSPNDFPFNSNVEGPDVSMPLSLTTQPTLKIEPKLASKNEDEMTIDYFVTKFGYRTKVNITAAATIGTVLFNANLSPAQQSATEVSYPKPYMMLAKLFRYWRGNFRFRIKFVKTKMHTARLMFAFAPGVTSNLSLTQAEYTHREVVDIAETDELVYELPFTAASPYLQCDNTGTYGSYGSFQIIVINALQAPASVADNIDLIIETAMGEGSEWYEPAPMTNSLPTVPLPALMTAPNFAQSGSLSLVKVSTLSDAKVTGHQTETAQLCVGEKLLSLRQIIKFPANLAASFLYWLATVDSQGRWGPMFYAPFALGATTTSGTLSVRTSDMLTLLAPYYRYSRGGMRVRGDFGTYSGVIPVATTGRGYMTAAARTHLNIGVLGSDATGLALIGGDIISDDNPIWKYNLPAWQSVPMVPHHYAVTSTVPDTSPMGHQTNLIARGYGFSPSVTLTIRLARQPADDYELMYFVGPPKFTTSVS
jgi:hypothetical protein